MSGLPDSEPVLLCNNLSKTNSNAISRVLRERTHTAAAIAKRGQGRWEMGIWEMGDGGWEWGDEREEERKKKTKEYNITGLLIVPLRSVLSRETLSIKRQSTTSQLLSSPIPISIC